MNKSESIKNIAVAMNKAQADITAAKKDSKNPFFKSSYADLGSVIKAIKSALCEHGLSYMQSPEMSENRVGVSTIIMHESGEWIESSLYLPLTKLDPQAAGSAITYARRYALQSMIGLPAADDDAEFAMNREPEKVELVTQKMVDFFVLGMESDKDETIVVPALKEKFAELSMEQQLELNTKLKDVKIKSANNRQGNTVLKDFLSYEIESVA